MPATDLSLLIGAAHAAGEVAKIFANKGARQWEKSDGSGPVTEADIAVNETLQTILCSARPDYGWLSEESDDDQNRLNCEHVFIIDPIDGTRSFIEGSGTWAHSIAVVDAGVVTAGVVFLPVRDKLYAAAVGQGATLNNAPIRTSSCKELDGASLLAAKPTYNPANWRGAVPSVERAFRPSLAYRLALVAEGRFDAMLTLRPTWEWDVAAGELIVREAGGVSSDRSAEPLRFNNANPRLNGIVATNAGLHAKMTGALTQ